MASSQADPTEIGGWCWNRMVGSLACCSSSSAEHRRFDSSGDLSGQMRIDTDQPPAALRHREADARIGPTGLGGLLSVPGKDLAHQHPVVVVARQDVAAIEPFLEQPEGRLVGFTPFVVSKVPGDDNAIELKPLTADRCQHLNE